MNNCHRPTNRIAIRIIVLGAFSLAFSCFVFSANPVWSQLQDERYGESTGKFKQSVNGLGVFTEMLRQHGANVKTQRLLSDRSDEAELLVWAPDRLDAPVQHEIDMLIERSSDNSWQKVLFIGRDYDATISYWEKILDQVPDKQRKDAEMHLESKRMRWKMMRGSSNQIADNKLFDYRILNRWEPVSELNGDLAQGVDESKSDLILTGETIRSINYEMDVLLEANGEPFVFVLTSYDFDNLLEIYVVTNGSLLLNLPLVNHENRKIAQNLIDLLDPKEVVVLDSGLEDITESSTPEPPNFWDWLAIQPYNWIISHLIFLGLLYLFCYFPIFGRPRRLPPATVSEFKTHISAVGKLMEQTGDKQFARDAIKHYQNITGQQSKT